MKLNLSLLLILIGLISFVYYWEELGHKSDFTSQIDGQKLIRINLQSIESIELKKSKILKYNNQWIVGELNYPANKSYIDFILKGLNGLVKSKEITGYENEEDFFKYQDHSFSISQAGRVRTFRLGDISEATGEFYISEFVAGVKRLYLARDINTYDGLFKNSKEAEFQKYIRLKDTLKLSPTQLVSPSLFSSSFFNDLNHVEIYKSDGEDIFLDLQNNTTRPEPIKNMDVLLIRERLLEFTSSFSIEKIFKTEIDKLKGLYTNIILKHKDKNYSLNLYREYKGRQGYFIYHSFYDVVLKVKTLNQTLFNKNVSDFWNKRFKFYSRVQLLKSFSFDFVAEEQRDKINVLDTAKFSYKSDKKLNTTNINLLFNILLNNKGFSQADLVKESTNFKGMFDLDFGEFKYSFRMKNSIISVFEHDTGLEFSFISRVKQRDYSVSDFFTKM